MEDFNTWSNLGGSAIMAAAFLFILRWVLQQYAEDKKVMMEIISNHLASTVQALGKISDVLSGLVSKVDHIDSDHLDRGGQA